MTYHTIKHPSISSQLTKTIRTPDIILKSGINQLDALLGGFKAGRLTYIDGTSTLISVLPNQLCVNTYRTFNSDTIYIDGGICADPYTIARYARTMEVDQDDILSHVRISRAFTVYQLSTFIEQLLEKEIETYGPRTLIVGNFPTLYLDPDVPSKESHTILHNNLQKLQELTTQHHLITILTNKNRRTYTNTIRNLIQSQVHETLRMNYIQPCTYVDLVNRQKSTTILDMTEGQLQLEHFGLVM